MGVGLTSIHERVRELGGRLKLESDAQGTSLRVAMPVEASHFHETLSLTISNKIREIA
jgi:signal transduction histidine kinase